MTTLQLTAGDDGRTLEVDPGDEVLLVLPENPTTGYRWHAELDPGLALDASDWKAGGPGVGAGGTRHLRIRAVQPGAAQVRVKHWREWQGDSSVTARHTVTLQVRSSSP